MNIVSATEDISVRPSQPPTEKPSLSPKAEPVKQGTHIPYDGHQLARAQTQWQFGDWDSLIELQPQFQPETLQHYPERAQLALYAATGHMQKGSVKLAKKLIRQAQEWGASKQLVNQMLASGIHNSLGRTKAIQGDKKTALVHFKASTGIGQPESALDLIASARARIQLEQIQGQLKAARLGLPSNTGTPSARLRLGSNRQSIQELLNQAEEQQQAGRFGDAQDFFTQALQLDPNNRETLAAIADNAMRCEDYAEAVRYWQDLIAELGAETPQSIYQQLTKAYEAVSDFGGTKEENRCWGDRHKHDILAQLHQQLKPRLYLEIGVDEGISLARAEGPAIGVDPRENLKLKVQLPDSTRIITASSDAFFRDQVSEELSEYLDLAYIDGMHLFEFALRDFINVERCSNPTTLVAIDDIHPCHPTQANRRRYSNSWTGDIWKLHAILKEYRPDLSLLDLNANTTGLLLIAGLDAKNEILSKHYDEIVEYYKKFIDPPVTAIVRAGVTNSHTRIIEMWGKIIRKARSENWRSEKILCELNYIKTKLTEV